MNHLHYGYVKRALQFSFEAITSRGALKAHNAYLIYVKHPSNPGATGWGEASPLKGLSIDDVPDFEDQLKGFLSYLNEGNSPHQIDMGGFPSIRFALETAQLDLINGGRRTLFENTFSKGTPIPINGLVWMSSIENMLDQAVKKAQEGFTCIKFKVGANDHDQECKLLENFRRHFDENKVEIRLDANGAFSAADALHLMKDFNQFHVHSIEQPIAPKQGEVLEEICAKSIIDIALDEELIGLDPEVDGPKLLKNLKAKYLILKPTLLGGMSASAKWIRKADEHHMQWWATSALESNIGLNAIAQWTAIQKTKLPQGLGTGNLYTNNFDSPLVAEKGTLYYIAQKAWQLPPLNQAE